MHTKYWYKFGKIWEQVNLSEKLSFLKWNIQRCYRNPYRLCDLSEM